MGSCALVKWSICDGGCVEHRLLHRCPLRNLLINSMVYVSGKTSLCQRKRRRLGVKDGDGETGGWAEGLGGGRRWPNSQGRWLNMTAIKIKCWDLLRELQQDLFGRTLPWPRGGQAPSSILLFLFFCLLSCSSVDWLQVSICCIRCHHTGGEVGWGGG